MHERTSPSCLLTIDLDDTLWPCDITIQRAEQAQYLWLAEHTPRLTARLAPADLRRHRKRIMERYPEIAHDMTVSRLRSFQQLFAEFGYPVEMATEVVELFRRHRNQVYPYPDVLPFLENWKGRVWLVSLTNGNAQVEQTPLGGWFDLALSAADVGAAKPAPDLFLKVMEVYQMKPEQMIHIGDDPERDIEAARRLGIATVWVNRNGHVWPRHLDPSELEVDDFGQISEWLRERRVCSLI